MVYGLKMKVSREIIAVGILTIIFCLNHTWAEITPLKQIGDYKCVVFIGTKLTYKENEVTEVIREVVGIGAILSPINILTTEEYMRWFNLENIEYFVLVGTHDFDDGGIEVGIREMTKPPQNNAAGSHTMVLLTLQRPVNENDGISRIVVNPKFVAQGEEVDMVGIYERDYVKIAISNETMQSNLECINLLNMDTKTDLKFKTFGSNMCLVSNNMLRVDCKSHIGTLIFVRSADKRKLSYLAGIKSDLHQSCSIVPYIIKFQRTAIISKWLSNNVIS